MFRQSKVLLSLILVFILALVTACSSSSKGAATSAPAASAAPSAAGSTPAASASSAGGDDAYNFGALLALTGNCGPLGQPTKVGIEYQIEKINQAKILDKPIKFQFVDDRSQPSETVALTNRFIDDKKTLGIVGYSCSNLALAGKPVVNEKKILQVAWAVSPEITNPVQPFTFTMTPTVVDEVDASIQYLASKNIKKVALLYEDTSYPKQAAMEWKKRASEFGITIAVEEMYQPDVKDLSVQVFKVASAKVEALLVEGTTNSAAAASKAAAQVKLNVPILFSSGATNPDFLQLTGPASEGNLGVNIGYAPVFENLPPDFPNRDKLSGVAADFKKFANRPIDTFAAAGMDLVNLTTEAVRIAKSKGEVNRQTVRDAYESITKYTGMIGEYNYTPQNHIGVTNATPVIQVKDGKWILGSVPAKK